MGTHWEQNESRGEHSGNIVETEWEQNGNRWEQNGNRVGKK